MNDSEFLELLNLYLDHEISAADAARLEDEVQSSAARRQTYLEYCRMQKACTLLAKDFATEPAEKKVIAFEPQRSSWASGAYAFGGLAVAAACVALVLVNRSADGVKINQSTNSGSVAAAQAAAVAPVAAETPVQVQPVAEKIPASAIARTVTVPVRNTDMRPIFAAAPLVQTVTNSDASALIAAAPQNAQAQFEWMKSMQLAPMQAMPAQELRLDPRSPLQPAGRTYTTGRPMQGEVQMSAFRFQK